MPLSSTSSVKPISLTQKSSVQNHKRPSSTSPSVNTAFWCWTEGCLDLRGLWNWGVCWTEGVGTEGCVELRGCWTGRCFELRDVLNWGDCWTLGCVELMGGLCGSLDKKPLISQCRETRSDRQKIFWNFSLSQSQKSCVDLTVWDNKPVRHYFRII